eukprot:8169525-Heterocapsa_arctica.AAC.1
MRRRDPVAWSGRSSEPTPSPTLNVKEECARRLGAQYALGVRTAGGVRNRRVPPQQLRGAMLARL